MNPKAKPARRRRPPQFELVAGALCLDFINTLDDRFSEHPKELLTEYKDLLRFAEDTGTLHPARVDRLLGLSHKMPDAAQNSLASAIQLREAMYLVFWAIVKKKPVPPEALAVLNQHVQAAAKHSKLVRVNGHFEWQFEDAPNDLEAPLWEIARSAADLLASEKVSFVHACASDTCQWLFLDTSKNHRRRWCDMKLCGNRAKVRAFYERTKEE